MVKLGMIFVTLSLITFILVPVSALRSDGYMYGYPCNYSSDCTSESGYSFAGAELSCHNGRCNCSTTADAHLMITLRYNSEESRFECDHSIFSMFSEIKCVTEERDTCIPNSHCVHGKQKWNPFITKHECVCNDGFIMIRKQCRDVEHVRVGEKCSTPETGPLKYCDINRNMSCIEGKCQCIRDYYNDNTLDACITKENYIEKFKANLTVGMFEFCGTNLNGLPNFCDEPANMTCRSSKCDCHGFFYYNESSSSCESKESFANENNLTSYRVMPGMYCHTNSDCIDGLTCFLSKCSCPYPCEYVARSSSCDCGKVSATEGAGPAIVVGCIGGAIIIAGWVYLIKKQIRKVKMPEYTTASTDGNTNYNNSNSAGVELLPNSNRSNATTPAQPSYPTQPSSIKPASYSSSTAADPQKHPLPPSVTPSMPYNVLPSYPSSTSDLPPPYSSHFPTTRNIEPTAPPSASATAPTTTGLEPTAPPNAPIPYPVATSQPGATLPGASAGIGSDVSRDPPPPYTPHPEQVDIYQPIV